MRSSAVRAMAEAILRTKGWDFISFGKRIFAGRKDYGPHGWHATLVLPPKKQVQAIMDFPALHCGPLDFIRWQWRYAKRSALTNGHFTINWEHLMCGSVIARVRTWQYGANGRFLPLESAFASARLTQELPGNRAPWICCALRLDGGRFLHICRREEVDGLPWNERINIYNPRVAAQYGQLPLPFLEKVKREIVRGI